MTPTPNARTVPTGGNPPSPNPLAVRLAARAAAAKPKPTPGPPRVAGVLDEDADDLCIIISKAALLEAVAPAPRNAGEGVTLAVEGEFTYRIGGREYRFHLRMTPAWARVDMLVGGVGI